jgi:hypothetical protein
VRVSRPKIVNKQFVLWHGADDKTFKSIAAVRNWAGDFFEEATHALTGAVRLKTDGSCDVCPDLKLRDKVYLESKCVGQSQSAIIYDHRFARDEKLVAHEGGEMFYCFWHHDLECNGCRTLFELRAGLATHVETLIVVKLEQLAALLKTRPIRTLNASYETRTGIPLGYGSNGYGRGWSFPLSLLVPLCSLPFVVDGTRAYGVTLRPYAVLLGRGIRWPLNSKGVSK